MSTVVSSSNQSINNPFVGIGHGIVTGTREFFKGVKQIHSDASALSRTVRLVGYCFALIAPSAFPRLHSVTSIIDPFVDSVQSIGSVHSLVSKPKKEDQPILKKMADVAFLGAGLGSVVQLLDTVGLVSLPTVASSTGSTGILGLVTKSNLGNAVLGILAAAFTLVGINSGLKLAQSVKDIKAAKADNNLNALDKAVTKRNQSILDIVWAVSEVAFFVLAIVAVLPPVALIAVGMVAATLGIVAFLHSQQRNAPEEQVKTAY
jgi:hypothetical protein